MRRRARIRRIARRRFAAVFAVPAAAAAVFLPSAAYLAYQELRVGAPRAELTRLLPARPFPYAPDTPGTTCEFYRSNSNLLEEVDLYRLCYSGGRLVTKDTVDAGGEPGSP
ncbi:hypothetical protein ACLGIH_00915 [Streptomyces sp. HMX87]|uniref:hypothetical protein n=1 Tax=Streptomyces sp. HMX87 TaxID=3390849 RepID=UPI003A8725ED